MAWRWLFSIREANTCTAWGYTFKVTDSHLTKDDTARMKMEYDRLGEAALDRLEFFFSPQASIQQNFQSFNKLAGEGVQQSYPQPPKRDMYVLLREYAPKDEVLGQLWAESNEVPPWVCWEQIERGQQVFYRYGGPALTGLAFQSLLGGMGATRIVETLTRTEDYIALFRYIAYLMGTPHEFFATPERAKMMMETLLRDEISPSATSRILANNILNSLEGQPPTFASRSFLEANCRALRRIMWSVIVEDKQGLGQESVFE
ncbi:MAG: hypothetical protein Q9180_002164 [Flavoplaca navasiana]